MIWIKALHIIFMVMWFAGLFYLPRLFVYHANTNDQPGNERFKIMERKLLMMTNIGMLGTLIFGLVMAMDAWEIYGKQGWMHAKLSCVFLLLGYHHLCGRFTRVFARDANTRSHTFYRWFNEVPALALFAIVILVVVKPF